MSTEVVVDQNLWTEIVDRRRKCPVSVAHSRTFDFRVREPSSRPVYWPLFYFIFLKIKLPIMPFSYFVIQFDIKIFGKKKDLIIRLFDIIVRYMNELALRALWLWSCSPVDFLARYKSHCRIFATTLEEIELLQTLHDWNLFSAVLIIETNATIKSNRVLATIFVATKGYDIEDITRWREHMKFIFKWNLFQNFLLL